MRTRVKMDPDWLSRYIWYSVQYKRWFWPFWINYGGLYTLESNAIEVAVKLQKTKGVVWRSW